MQGSYPNRLQICDGTSVTVRQDGPELVGGQGLPGPHSPVEFAEKLYACETLACGMVSDHATKTGRPSTDEAVEPYTLQWFLDIENQRHSRHGRWIPRLLEFAKHSGESLLGLGNGLGTDWLQYARHGAVVTVCSSSAGQLGLIRRNFELRGLTGRFLHSSPGALPLASACIDVACVSSLLHEVTDAETVVQELYRVLKPGGKVLAVTPARFDVDFWYKACFPWQRWLDPRLVRMNRNPVVGFTARTLKQLFKQFIEHRVYKRHLRRRECPHIWRWLPLPLLERCMGRTLVLKAFKPLSAAIALPLAA